MNKVYSLIFFLTVFILGCTSKEINQNKILQKIDSLDMNIFSSGGDKIYSIASPYSSFDNIALKFNLKETTINIFKGEEIKYVIKSDESSLS